MSRCARVRDLLGSYLGDDLRPRERQLVTSHLAVCARCAEELRACESLLTRLPTDSRAFAPADTRARILGRVQVRRRELAASRVPFWQGRTARGLVFATTVGAAAVVAVWLWLPPPGSRPAPGGDRPGLVGESPPGREPVVVPQPSPSPAPPVVPQVENRGLAGTSPPVMGLRPTSTNRRYDRRREAARKRAKKAQEEREAAARAAQQPEPEVVAPAPNGPDDATVVTTR